MRKLVELTVQPEIVELLPDKKAALSLTVKNRCSFIDSYDVVVSGIAPDWYQIDNPRINLNPGQSEQVEVALRPTKGPASKAGVYPVKVVVTSRTDEQIFDAAVITLKVGLIGDIAMAVTAAALEGRDATFELTLDNQYNEPVTVTLEASDNEGKLRFEFVPVATVIIAEFGKEQIKVHVEPSSPEAIGEAHLYRIAFRARVAGQDLVDHPPLDQSAMFTYRPVVVARWTPRWLRPLPPWALMILAPILLLLVGALAFFVFTAFFRGAIVQVTPAAAYFGRYAVSSNGSESAITIANTGSKALVFPVTSPPSDAIIIPLGSKDFNIVSQLDGCAQTPTVAVGGQCSIAIKFTPTVSGTITATLNLSDNADSGTRTVPLSGTGYFAPGINPDASSLSFGRVAVHSILTHTVTITDTPPAVNGNNGPLVISTAAIGGSHARDFIITKDDCITAPVQPGHKCTITVGLKPIDTGDLHATLAMTDEFASVSQQVALAGTAYFASGAGFDPPTLSFADQGAGVPSAAHTIAISDTGQGDLRIGSVTIVNYANQGAFAIAHGSDDCSHATIHADKIQCRISITFTPTMSGTITGTLELRDNAGNGLRTDHTDSVPLVGKGYYLPVVILSSDAVTFGEQAVGTDSHAQPITVSDTGQSPFPLGPLKISSIAVKGSNAKDFTVTHRCAGPIIPVEGNCIIYVTFKPRDSGPRQAYLAISDYAHSQPQMVKLLGNAYYQPKLTVSATSLDFGQTVVRTHASLSVSISVSGRGHLRLDGAAVTGPDQVAFAAPNSADTCRGFTIDTANPCTIDIEFSPTISQTYSATLTIGLRDNGNRLLQRAVLLNGAGVNLPGVEIPSSLSFGPQTVNGSVELPVHVTNNSLAPVKFTSDPSLDNQRDFTLASSTCHGTIEPGQSCVIQVDFHPSQTASVSGSLTIYDNASNNSQ